MPPVTATTIAPHSHTFVEFLLQPGGIAWIALVGIIVLTLIGVGLWCCKKKCKRSAEVMNEAWFFFFFFLSFSLVICHCNVEYFIHTSHSCRVWNIHCVRNLSLFWCTHNTNPFAISLPFKIFNYPARLLSLFSRKFSAERGEYVWSTYAPSAPLLACARCSFTINV